MILNEILTDLSWTITKDCPITFENYKVSVPREDYLKYQNGELVQNAFPYLSRTAREFIITGLTPAEQDIVYYGKSRKPKRK